MKKIIIWTSALAAGVLLGMTGLAWIDSIATFVATVYTRLFQLLALPTIALAVVTTLASLSRQQGTGCIFLHTLSFTLLTTFAAAAVGAVLYIAVAPGNLPSVLATGAGQQAGGTFFLTLSLMAGTGAPVGIMGIILPVYTIIDMVETAENVWSDSCVCAMVNKSAVPK